MSKSSSSTRNSVSRIRGASADDFTRKQLYGLAKKISPTRYELWDDMVQVGEIFLIRARELYDDSHGVAFRPYAYPLLERTMRRVVYKELAQRNGSSIRKFESGIAEIIRVEVEDLESFVEPEECLTPIERLDLFTIQRAVWQAAHENGDVYILWKYSFIRNCIFSDRMTFAEFGKRYQKRPNSLYFFRDRLFRDARKILGLSDD